MEADKSSENRKGRLLRVLLNRAHGNVTEPLLKGLSPHDIAMVLQQPIIATDITPLIDQPLETLSKLHYSWIHTYLAPIESSERQLLVACLDEPQRSGVARLFQESTIPSFHSPLVCKFYRRKLLPLLPLDRHLPLEYLPKSAFTPLAQLSKSQLVSLIDFLGLYDLAHEIRQIVATKNLKNLYTCLSAKQQEFLRLCLHQKDKVVTPSLHLERWNGECEILLRLLHRRGLTRLAIALSGQHPDLVWYITHILDTGRGRLLGKQVRKEEIPQLSMAVSLQVESALNHLKAR